MDFASQLANLQRAATRAGGSSSDSNGNGNVNGSIRGFVEEGSDGVRHTSTTSLRRKIVDEGGYHDASLSNQESNKRTRHTVTTTTTTTIYQRPTVPVQTIYIACPSNIETGGPEALHQLCHVINNIAEAITTMLPPRRDNDCGIDCGGGGSKHCITKNNISAGNVRAFMLYLRERNNNGGTKNNNAAKGGGMRKMEHVISTTACPTRYARYDAPPAPNLPGHNNSSSNGAATNNGVVSTTVHSSEMVVWPECWTHLIDTLLPPFPPVGQTTPTTNVSYQNVIWWLSVDNNKGSFTTKDFVNRRDVLHLVQSAYAYNYVSSHLRHRKDNDDNVNDEKSSNRTHHPDVIDLTEYIWQPSPSSNNNVYPPAEENADNTPSPAVIVTTTPSQPILHRDIDVVYNPAKGMHYTNEIIRRAGQTLQIVPIGKGPNGQIRMTGNEVTNLLCRAKVYIDFGPHPGMDRLPREAALAGCIVLTNREGAAGYDVDVPLPTEFKFGGLFNVEKVYALLREICVSSSSNKSEEEEKRRYEVYVNKMKPYKNWIHGQEGRMRDCVDRFINEVVTLRQMC